MWRYPIQPGMEITANIISSKRDSAYIYSHKGKVNDEFVDPLELATGVQYRVGA